MFKFLFIATLFSLLFGHTLISKNLSAHLEQYVNSFTFKVVFGAQSNNLSHFIRLALYSFKFKNLALIFALNPL